MTLEKFLKKANGAKVCIGTSEGAGFIYIGPSDDIKTIKKAFNSIKENAKRLLEKSKKKLRFIYRRCGESSLLGLDEKDKEKVIFDRLETINGYYTTYARNTDILKKYKEPLGRTVTKAYKSDVHDGIICIVTGDESGRFWLENEFTDVFGKSEER